MQCTMAFLLRAQFVILAFAMDPLDTVAISLLDPKRSVVLKREISGDGQSVGEGKLRWRICPCNQCLLTFYDPGHRH